MHLSRFRVSLEASTVDRSQRVRAYLDAVEVPAGPPTRALLATLVKRHLETFPFTSVGPVLGNELPLDPDAVFDRIVTQRRGGYCFEHNALFFDVLSELGFDCRLVLAGVMFTTDDPPLDHRTTIVALSEGEFIADVGLGWPTPTVPVPMNGDVVGDSWRQFRIAQVTAELWQVQSFRKDRWAPSYRFELREYTDADCEIGHAACGRDPESQFVTNVIASLIFEDEIRSLRNREYRVITPRGSKLWELRDVEDLARVLEEDLGVDVAPDELARLWERANAPTPG